ncbi:MAG: hypothetical protein V4731_17985 [Pseudomonadota bacterium]
MSRLCISSPFARAAKAWTRRWIVPVLLSPLCLMLGGCPETQTPREPPLVPKPKASMVSVVDLQHHLIAPSI